MLLDTSGLLCYISEAEPYHSSAVTLIKTRSTRFLTHSQALSELVALSSARRFSRSVTLAFLTELIDDPEVEIVWVDEYIHKEAMQLLRTRLDKTYSLCDAISFILMKQRHIIDALTTDHHFEQEGFVRLLP